MISTPKSECFEGVRDAFAIALAVAIFGMLFGATGVNSSLSLWQSIGSSASVFAGASQFVFLDLYNQKVPVWSILVAVFAINFRHVLYSASLGRYMSAFSPWQKTFGFFLLTDLAFAASEQRAATGKLTPAYFFGYGVFHYCVWIFSTAFGAWLGNLVTNPYALGMDMLLPIYFLPLLMGFRFRANWLSVVLFSALVSTITYKTIGSPWHITLGAFAGILVAALVGKPNAKKADDHG